MRAGARDVPRREDEVDVGVSQCGEQARDRLGRMAQVGVHHHEDVTGGGAEAFEHGLAEVAACVAHYDPHPARLAETLGQARDAVVARIVNDQELERERVRRPDCLQAAHQDRHVVDLPVGRDDDRDRGSTMRRHAVRAFHLAPLRRRVTSLRRGRQPQHTHTPAPWDRAGS